LLWKEGLVAETAATGKIQETRVERYKSTKGIDYDSVPWRLWEKSKKLFWDPADLDFSQDAIDWQEMPDQARLMIAMSARGFMVGEEAVTLDIVPLLRTMSDLGRLEDTMYLSMFAMEEAKHTDMFRRWFDAVDFDPRSLDEMVRAQAQSYGSNGDGDGNAQPRRRGLFDGELTKVMRRLDTDRSPEAILDATIVYNQLVEGVAAIGGYRRWNAMFRMIEKLPGLEKGINLTQRDERRHIAYGTYLGRRLIAENPELWEFAERRWEELTSGFGQGGYGNAQAARQAAAAGYDPDFVQGLLRRRLDALAVARTMRVDEVESSDIDSFVPEELLSVN
jgi:ribonucleoside-diphosphate reductase beta chain